MTGIVDGHHHIWRQADLSWLSGPMQPRIFGPYEPIRRDYPIAEYLDDLAGSGVTRSVYVQTNWPNNRFEDEAAWVQETSNRHGWPHGLVAYADFSVDDVRPQLDRLHLRDGDDGVSGLVSYRPCSARRTGRARPRRRR